MVAGARRACPHAVVFVRPTPGVAWPGLSACHSLGLAVGDHADDAHNQQSHADASDSQNPLLVQLLGFCRGMRCEGAGQEVDLWR